jgi:integrase
VARGTILSRRNRDGSVTYSIKYRTNDGTQVKKAIGASRRAAEKALSAALVAIDRGELVRPTRETFESYARRWLADHRPRVERATAIDYTNSLENHLLPYFGALRLTAITTDHVRAYVAAKIDGTAPVRDQPQGRGGRIKRALSPKTVNNQVGLLGLILGHAAADGLISRSPIDGRDRRRPLKLKPAHKERDYLRPDEVPLYLEACSEFWLPRATTLILTGLRIGELLALDWGDVDWQGHAIVVRHALKRGTVGSTKGDETGRRVDMGPHLVAVFRRHRAQHMKGHGGATHLVFPGPRSGYDDPGRLLRQEHREALRQAGLRLSLVNHELRHTAAAVWLSLGLPMEYVRRQMGHRHIATTIRAYGHLERTMIPDAAARSEAALLGPFGTNLVPRGPDAALTPNKKALA